MFPSYFFFLIKLCYYTYTIFPNILQVSFGVRNVPKYLYFEQTGIPSISTCAGTQRLLVLVSCRLPFKSFIIGILSAFLLAKITIPDFFLLSNIPFFLLHFDMTLITFLICSTEVHIVKRSFA